jgi:hypothetical protein
MPTPALASMFNAPSKSSKNSQVKTTPALASMFNAPSKSKSTKSTKSSESRTLIDIYKTVTPKHSLSGISSKKDSSLFKTVRRIARKYSKTCRESNLNELLTWKDGNWTYTNTIFGDIYDNGKLLEKNGVPSESLIDIQDKHFPKIIQGHFTKSLFNFERERDSHSFIKKPKINENVLSVGNRVQLWKLLDKKEGNWHVSCVIWYMGEPYSFGFDRGVIKEGEKHPRLVMNSPNNFLEMSILRQKLKNPTLDKNKPKFLELLAISHLDENMIRGFKSLLTQSSNIHTAVNIDRVFQGFEPMDKELYEPHITELEEARTAWDKHLNEKLGLFGKKTKPKNKAPKGYSYSATKSLPILIKLWDNNPFLLSYNELQVSFNDLYYCRKDPGRKSSKKNCMGALDTIFQDIFSCRLFGTYVIPKLCGPKTKCFTPDESVNNTQQSSKTGSATNTIRSATSATSTANTRSIYRKYRETTLGGSRLKRNKSRKLRF